MAEYLSPGIFIEEVSTATQSVEAVGTSTMAIAGWTPMGPANEAVLVTSPDSYSRRFGGYTNDSRVPGAVTAFFANGGVRAYVVRVTPGDAEAASGGIPGQTDGESYGAGTGAGVTLAHTLSAGAPRPLSTVVSWTAAGTAPPQVVAGSGTAYSATLASIPLTNDDVTVAWQTGGLSPVDHSITIDSAGVIGGDPSDVAMIVAGSTSLDRVTGELEVTFTGGGTPDPTGITVTYTPVGSGYTVTDDGSGAFSGSGATGTVDYTNGDCSITWASNFPYNGCPITVSYFGRMWVLSAANEGEWGNNLKVVLQGNPNYLVYGTTATTNVGNYTKFDLLVYLKNETTGDYDLVESYEELSFADPTDPMYAPEVINDASDYIQMTDMGVSDVPANFHSTIVTGETDPVLLAGDGTKTEFTYNIKTANPAHVPVLKGSLVVHYTDGASYTLTSSSSGSLVSADGFLDTTKTNSINYITGELTINFLPAHAPDAGTSITLDYVVMPEAFDGLKTSDDYLLTGGSDGDLSSVDRSLVSDPALLQADKLGMYALDRIDEMMMLILPDFAGDVAVQGDMIDYASSRRDLFAILSTPKGYSAQEAVDYVRITFPRKSKYAAMYWPWIKIADPLANGRPLLVPPVAHVAGIYARTDISRNVSKAPGGTVDGALRYLIGLERNPDKGERDTVSPARINTLINTPQTGMAVWGVRTLSSTNDAFKYIASTRLFQFVEKSVFNSTHSLVFENMNTNLYTRIKGQIESFLLNLFNNGYFAGTAPSQAYFVKCDASNNPPEVFNAGQIVCDIGLAPNRPGEFIRFRFTEKLVS